MIELFDANKVADNRQSSKGNQLKWECDGIWYKADYTGYEGLAEYVVSQLLMYSTLQNKEFVCYRPERISYKHTVYNAAASDDFLTGSWQIITLERLFKTKYNRSLYESIWKVRDGMERFRFLCNQVKNMTGLKDFDKYLNKLFTVDAVFLNEDRHMHNIAVLVNDRNEFDYCPIFDNGACLLSDTSMDYPLDMDCYELMGDCHAKTISRDFDEQLDVSEILAGRNLYFSFTQKEVERIVDGAPYYSEDCKTRVKDIIFSQMRKYQYLFS